AKAPTDRKRGTKKKATKRARKAKKARIASLPPIQNPKPSRPPNRSRPRATSLRANKFLSQRDRPHPARPSVFEQKLAAMVPQRDQGYREHQRRECGGPGFFSDQRPPDFEDRPRQPPISTRSAM